MALHNKDLQKLQALMMINMKVHGMGNAEIAKQLNIHKDTVERRLAFANKAGLYVDFEKQIIEELLPAAMKAIKTALEDGDSETAMELLKAMNVISDPKAPKTQAKLEEEDNLAKAIAEAREVKQLEEGTIDGEIISKRGFAGLLESGDGGDESPAETAASENRNSMEPAASTDPAQTP